MSIEQGTIAAKLVGVNQTKLGLSGVLQNWGEEVPQTFGAYPDAFNNVFTDLDGKIDDLSTDLSNYVKRQTDDVQTINTPLCNLQPLSAFELNAAYGTNAAGIVVSYGTVSLNNMDGRKTTLYPARTVTEKVGNRIKQVSHNPEIKSYNTADLSTYTLTIPYESGTIATRQYLSSNYALLSDIPLSTSQLTNDSGFLTAHQSLSDYPTKSEIEQGMSAFVLTSDLTGYATKAETDGKINALSDSLSDYATTDSLSGFALTSDIPLSTSQLINDSGFLTAHQDISMKADMSSVYTKSEADSTFLTAHQSLADCVKMTGTQEISGYKSFYRQITMNYGNWHSEYASGSLKFIDPSGGTNNVTAYDKNAIRHYTRNSQGNDTLNYTYWLPSYTATDNSARLVVDHQINNTNAIINSNFTNLKDEFTQKTHSISPTVTFASGWSIHNNDNVSIKTLTGRVAIISFSVKCTSALTAGTSYKPFASFSFPSGITLAMGAGVNATRRCWIYFNSVNTEIIPEVNIAASTPLYARGVIGLNIPSTATSYMPTITTISNI